MNRIIILALLLISSMMEATAQTKSLYDFTVKDIDGKNFDMSTLKGKKVLIVNVASKCGLTPQYEELEKLYQKYKDRGLVIVGFPANNFMGQEPGTNEEIKNFCSVNYSVTFPMMSKIDVKGENMAPLYKWLTQKSENGKMDAEVTWNFQKFMIGEDGQWAGYATPKTSPMSPEIVDWIEERK